MDVRGVTVGDDGGEQATGVDECVRRNEPCGLHEALSLLYKRGRAEQNNDFKLALYHQSY